MSARERRRGHRWFDGDITIVCDPKWDGMEEGRWPRAVNVDLHPFLSCQRKCDCYAGFQKAYIPHHELCASLAFSPAADCGRCAEVLERHRLRMKLMDEREKRVIWFYGSASAFCGPRC